LKIDAMREMILSKQFLRIPWSSIGADPDSFGGHDFRKGNFRRGFAARTMGQ